MFLPMLSLLEYILYNTYIYELFVFVVVCLFSNLALSSHAPGPLVSALHSCYFGYPRFMAT